MQCVVDLPVERDVAAVTMRITGRRAEIRARAFEVVLGVDTCRRRSRRRGARELPCPVAKRGGRPGHLAVHVVAAVVIHAGIDAELMGRAELGLEFAGQAATESIVTVVPRPALHTPTGGDT